MVVLDTNVYIYFLEKNPEYFQRSERAIREALNHGPIILPTITIMEIMSGTNSDKVISFFSGKQFKVCDITLDIAIGAGKLRYEYKALRAADAIFIATVIEQRADYFVTNDNKLKSLDLKALEIRSL
jgi:predicted nucleic acid-binding protein